MVASPFSVPPDIKFADAIALTQSLLGQMEAGTLAPAQISDVIADLVKTQDGARGFFVTYLTSESSLPDQPSPEVVEALRSSPEIVAELLTKNLAMSAAQALVHRRNDDEKMAQGSDQVNRRTANLIRLLNLDSVRDRCQQLLESVTTGEGNYKAFLERWGYDAQQKQVMAEALRQVISLLSAP